MNKAIYPFKDMCTQYHKNVSIRSIPLHLNQIVLLEEINTDTETFGYPYGTKKVSVIHT